MAMEVLQEEEGHVQCVLHPYKNRVPGGVCPFCLQEKLKNLVSSSFSGAIFPSFSSSPSPSFRSDFGGAAAAGCGGPAPFLLSEKMKKKKEAVTANSDSAIVFQRSKSTATPRRGGIHSMNADNYSLHRRRFWSFLYRSREKKGEGSPENPSLNRKVSRSRSVGCGSRSFSGDFFERISTGFSDCTLRRIESPKEENQAKLSSTTSHDCIKEGIKNRGRIKNRGWTFSSPMRAFGKPPSGKNPFPGGKLDFPSTRNSLIQYV